MNNYIQGKNRYDFYVFLVVADSNIWAIVTKVEISVIKKQEENWCIECNTKPNLKYDNWCYYNNECTSLVFGWNFLLSRRMTA